MDYVLFGMGYGATLMLLGWALRTFGPERKYKDINPEDRDLVVAQRRWVRFIQGLGGVIAIAGTAMVVFTFIIMLVNPDDETGSFTALVVWGFLIVAVLVWCGFYVSRYGLTGIWSRDHGYGLRGGKMTSLSPSTRSGLSTTRVVPKPRVADSGPTAVDPVDSEADVHEPHDAGAEVASDDLVGPPLVSEGPPLVESVAEDDESAVAEVDPEYDFGDSSDTTVPSEIGGRSEALRRLRERQARSDNSTNQ